MVLRGTVHGERPCDDVCGTVKNLAVRAIL